MHFFFQASVSVLTDDTTKIITIISLQTKPDPNVSGMVSLIFHRGYLSYGFDLPPGLGQ